MYAWYHEILNAIPCNHQEFDHYLQLGKHMMIHRNLIMKCYL